VNENNNDGVVYCETCWEKTQRLRVRDRRIVVVQEKLQLDEDVKDDPWEECIDDASGCVYYYNTITNESVWERPEIKEIAQKKEQNKTHLHELDFESGQLINKSERTTVAVTMRPSVVTFPSFRLFWKGQGWYVLSRQCKTSCQN